MPKQQPIPDIQLGVHNIAPNYGFLIDKVPQNVMDELKVQIDKMQNSGFKNETSYIPQLVGEIENEYKLNPGPNLVNYLKNCNKVFDQQLGFYPTYFNHKNMWSKNVFGNGVPLTMKDDNWVNFMKKHEYNPPHFHKGLVSWVIWYQIPYTFEEEKKFSAKSPDDQIYHGEFAFQFNHPAFGIQSLSMYTDKSKEGHLVMFPATLHHRVSPFFSSDEYRITVAGNFKLNSDKVNQLLLENG